LTPESRQHYEICRCLSLPSMQQRVHRASQALGFETSPAVLAPTWEYIHVASMPPFPPQRQEHYQQSLCCRRCGALRFAGRDRWTTDRRACSNSPTGTNARRAYWIICSAFKRDLVKRSACCPARKPWRHFNSNSNVAATEIVTETNNALSKSRFLEHRLLVARPNPRK
jgi:hypothetical protein